MKIITEPSVSIISQQVFSEHPKYELPAHDNDAENIMATAGKVCYDSYGKDGRSVVEHVEGLVDSAHLSVLEHVHVGLFIEGISRGCSHEIVRHRMFNYSQRSTRYTAEEDAAIVLDPFYANLYVPGRSALQQPFVVEVFLRQCESALHAYKHSLSVLEPYVPAGMKTRDARKWMRGKARQLLPHALETRMVVTGNLRAWRHFLLMRTSRFAEAEIRRLAHMIGDILLPIAPTAFSDFQSEMVDGYIELTMPAFKAVSFTAEEIETVRQALEGKGTRFRHQVMGAMGWRA